MRTVLILDTETTGLDPATDAVIEVGCVLYSVTHATVIESFASLIRADGNAAEAVNRIPVAALRNAPDAEDVWPIVDRLVFDADAFLAHNAEFDRAFVPPNVGSTMPWICTKSDLVWPKQTHPESSLVPLALEHDLGVATAHRALDDAMLIARLLTRSAELGCDLVAMIERGMRPKTTLQALVSFDDRELAKAAGFRWHPETKRWLRRMVAEDAAALPFPTREAA